MSTANVEVRVWDYSQEAFIHHIPCDGEERVRVDYFGDLENLDVYQGVVYPDGSFVASRLLSHWKIHLS